jgi:type II secretory pathway component PulJ
MTLHELLVACALCGLVFAAIYGVLDEGLRAYTTGAARAESQQTARVALERLAREIRQAGRGGVESLDALLRLEPARITLASDLDGDGRADSRGEQVTWHLAAGGILRRDAGGGAQPLANGVQAFEIKYLDESLAPTLDPGAVRLVEIAVVTAHPRGPSSLARGVTTRVETRVRLRNR